MNHSFQNLSRFFEEIKVLGFWKRIFGWEEIKKLSYDAYEEFKKLFQEVDGIGRELEKEKNNSVLIQKDIDMLKTSDTELRKQIGNKENEIKELNRKQEEINLRLTTLSTENAQFKQTEESRRNEYDKNVAGVNAIRTHLENEISKLKSEREKEIITRFEKMKITWSEHELSVENTIREICRKHTIEYFDKEKVPFKGKPDNTIKIADEYVIFDAKSPANDDLQNFPTYIKLQSESVKKYIKEENVKKNIFLVVPSNTVHSIKQFTYNLGDYDVYVVTIDTLEPIILSLKKIEEYEFAEQLSPEERENICRLLGKFAHLTKRRVQIDFYFSQEFFSILGKCKSDLPSDILKSVIEFEKSEKLNPPQEKRAKQILTSDLEKESVIIRKEAEAKGIIFPDELSSIKNIPLSSKND